MPLFRSIAAPKATTQPVKIAISYRRSESKDIAGRIFDRLTARYGPGAVFMDVARDIPFGDNFRVHIRDVLQQTSLVIAIIGPDWCGSAADGSSRIRSAEDPIRFEIETALSRPVPIVPILVNGAGMPARSDLPESIGALVELNAAEVSGGKDFYVHMDRLTAAIDRLLGLPPAVAATAAPHVEEPWGAWSLGMLCLFAPPFALLVLHDLIVFRLDLNTRYLGLASFAVPTIFGYIFARRVTARLAPGVLVAIVVALVSVSAMVVSLSLNMSAPILPSTIGEAREIFEYFATISLGWMLGFALARFTRDRRTG